MFGPWEICEILIILESDDCELSFGIVPSGDFYWTSLMISQYWFR